MALYAVRYFATRGINVAREKLYWRDKANLIEKASRNFTLQQTRQLDDFSSSDLEQRVIELTKLMAAAFERNLKDEDA